jgi:hypothetical protein
VIYGWSKGLTYLVVVIFGGVDDRDISGFERFARSLKPIVHLLGDTESSGSYPQACSASGRAEEGSHAIMMLWDAPPPRTRTLYLSLDGGASVLAHRTRLIIG